MKIGKYEVQDELGRGSMGVVYRAKDPLLDRQVAIKLLSAEGLDELSLPLFEREAKAVAKMSHPNIVVVHEFDYVENEPYIVMELLKGSSLDELGEDLDLATKLRIAEQALKGLQHAHEQGVIHRDIKPTNIFVTDANIVKILDFGVARLAAGSSSVTSGFILGTPEYMSPEQIEAKQLDGRSDIFSLGSVLYWMLTGYTPFDRETAEQVMYAIVNSEPPPMAVEGISAFLLKQVQSILNRALAKDPAERFSSASEMANEIQGLLVIVEAEAERQQQDSDLDMMQTVEVSIPKFSTTRKRKGNVTPSKIADVAPKAPLNPPPQEPQPETIEKTVEFRSMPQPSELPPALPVPPNTTQNSAPASSAPMRNLIILLIILLLVVALLLITTLR